MFDIRVPLGILFATLGVMLSLHGLSSGSAPYEAHSLGVNLNLWWGAAMTLFGLVMLLLTRLNGR